MGVKQCEGWVWAGARGGALGLVVVLQPLLAILGAMYAGVNGCGRVWGLGVGAGDWRTLAESLGY